MAYNKIIYFSQVCWSAKWLLCLCVAIMCSSVLCVSLPLPINGGQSWWIQFYFFLSFYTFVLSLLWCEQLLVLLTGIPLCSLQLSPHLLIHWYSSKVVSGSFPRPWTHLISSVLHAWHPSHTSNVELSIEKLFMCWSLSPIIISSSSVLRIVCMCVHTHI